MSSSPTEILLPHRPADVPLPTAVTEGEHRHLLVALAVVPDPRDPRGRRYPLVSILSVAVCAVLAGACMFAAVADWVRDLDQAAWDRLGFTDRLPAATTVWRLLIRIDAELLSQVLARWTHRRHAQRRTGRGKLSCNLTSMRAAPLHFAMERGVFLISPGGINRQRQNHSVVCRRVLKGFQVP
jgi:hypothetical protein